MSLFFPENKCFISISSLFVSSPTRNTLVDVSGLLTGTCPVPAYRRGTLLQSMNFFKIFQPLIVVRKDEGRTLIE
jgi:hypothetical protein